MIKTKRDSLERFLREQMIGPGACNNKFSLVDIEPLFGTEICEVINTTPGSVYSSGILFPKREQGGSLNIQKDISFENEDLQDTSTIAEFSERIIENDPDELENEDSTINDDEVSLRSDEEDIYSLSQRFPNAIGLSCCLNPGGESIKNDDLKITISGRYYHKIDKSNFHSVVINISEDYDLFTCFFSRFNDSLSPYFTLRTDGISINKSFSKEYPSIREQILSINKQLCREVATFPDGTIDETFLSIGENYRYLKSYKERLWSILHRLKANGGYLTVDEKESILSKLKSVEQYETFVSYLEDAVSLCKPKNYGFWIGENFRTEINLNNIDLNFEGRKKIFSPNSYAELNHIVSYDIDDINVALSIWLQITKGRDPLNKDLYLKVQLQNVSTPFIDDGKHYFSIVTEEVNKRCFFGVRIDVNSPLLCAYQKKGTVTDVSNDIDQLNFLYRDIKDYGIGHMCSVDWTIGDNHKNIHTEFMPICETPDVEPVPRDKYSDYIETEDGIIPHAFLENSKALEFKWLSTFSEATDEEIKSELYSFVDAYGRWINTLKERSVLLDTNKQDLARQNIEKCQNDFIRMKSNITLLLKSPTNILAFRLMNSAMFMQLWHGKNRCPKDECITEDFYINADDNIKGKPMSWRPFQIAFILLNLDGILQRPDDPQWKARNELVDLVWFPTGGGKTEAYLGIIALSILIRKLHYSLKGGGTTAIMRYTLRLLANQQFRRAMRVIMALELLRRWHVDELGGEPISIGLFVGSDSLPNTLTGNNIDRGLLKECQAWNTRTSDNKRNESRIPLDKCPWCGEPLEYKNNGTDTNPKINFRCENIDCVFEDNIPVLLCDESIYLNPPTLLFGTVDKFAALGHKLSNSDNKKDSRSIFGKRNNLPPSLIIQDELHLLLGPLGSAVSLFEGAIDQLCTYKDENGLTIRPKIISSTATTRNTDLQIRALYDREVNIFPKNGIDYDDSFFAFYKRHKINGQIEFVSKRKYIGILPTGRTQITTQMRLIASMFVHRALFEDKFYDKINTEPVSKAIDYYHTIISYFNSLKEVGRTDAQFYSEFTKYTRRLFKRVFRFRNLLECQYCYDTSFSKSELTGRLTGSEVNDELTKVENKWVFDHRYPYFDESLNRNVKGSTPPDLVLATNMISVGIDVDRFNTILMNSMPRNIAEYIQASSRVARNDLGIVITLHNPFRARDLSHFERFKEFHEKLYYYVEPISITPFSKKAIDKYLPLYLATMIRHNYEELSENPMNLTVELKSTITSELKQYFNKRLERSKELPDGIKDLLTEDLCENIFFKIEESLKLWMDLIEKAQESNKQLVYSGAEWRNKITRTSKYVDLFMAIDDYREDLERQKWLVPMSLRNVEPEGIINIIE